MVRATSQASSIKIKLTPQGLAIDKHVFRRKVPLQRYVDALGNPTRTIDAGPPAPAGHRNNQVHVFDSFGIYLTQHHASGLIESVNCVFDPSESPFPMGQAFAGTLEIDGMAIHADMAEAELNYNQLRRDLPGEYSLQLNAYWIGISAIGRKGRNGKRERVRRVVRVSICFLE